MQITEHFSLSEFGQHAGYGLPAEPYPLAWIARLQKLCKALELIRAKFNKPIRILSAYRSVAYNDAMYKAQGQTPTKSQHSQGNAADICIDGIPAQRLHAVIKDMFDAHELDIGGLGKYPGFVHVDIRDRHPDTHLAQWEGHGS